MPCYDNIDGVWRKTNAISDNIDGVWRNVKYAADNIDGVWRNYHTKLAFSDNFQEYLGGANNLNGTRQNGPVNNSYILIQVSGFTGGENYAISMGWTIINIPAGSTVVFDWELYKGAYPRNDALVVTSSGGQSVFSESFSRRTNSFTNQASYMNVFLNFFSTASITSFIKIYSVTVNGQQIFPL